MNMSFVFNDSQQLSLFDKLAFLSPHMKKMLDASWAKAFSDHIFSKIDESIFIPLYSQNSNSRPNAPVNVLVGALMLKEFNGLTDEEITASCCFDFRYQYALHTTSFEEQPVSTRTLSRFRTRLASYKLTTGTDLVHECFVKMADDIREYMDISPSIKRMDSMMVESNIRKMGRLELLYTCLSNLVKELHNDGREELLKGLEHYKDPNDRNKVIYHDSGTPQSDRLQKVIDDAVGLLPKCAEDYSDTTDYQLLERAINEQTKDDGNGKTVPKQKGDGMDSSSLQNPADPDATYRIKAGREHRGYAANITETVDENGSVVTDYQYDVNTHSDTAFLHEAIESSEISEETTAVIADGAYAGKELQEEAAGKNIGILTTGLRGRAPRDILTKFSLSEDEHTVLSCPAGNEPNASSYNASNNTIRVSFPVCCCENCEHRDECRAKIGVRTAVVMFSLNSLHHTQEVEAHKKNPLTATIGRIRNGIETIPSILRRKYHVDHMPVRGKSKTEICFGFKMLALNFTKLWLHDRHLQRSRAFEPVNG